MMSLLALADDTILTIVTAFITFLGTVFTGIMAYYMAKLNTKAKDAAAVVNEAVVNVKEATLKAGEVQAALNRATATVSNKLEDVIMATNTSNDLLTVGNTIATENKG